MSFGVPGLSFDSHNRVSDGGKASGLAGSFFFISALSRRGRRRDLSYSGSTNPFGQRALFRKRIVAQGLAFCSSGRALYLGQTRGFSQHLLSGAKAGVRRHAQLEAQHVGAQHANGSAGFSGK